MGWAGWPRSRGREAACTRPPAPRGPSPPQTELRECDYSKFMSVLDANKDCEVDFVEYVRSLACLCTYCHDYFKDCSPEPPCPQ